MITVSHDYFEQLVNEAFSSLPKTHLENLKNVAIIVEDEPSDQKRRELKLGPAQTLLGLYEGVPLSQRQGTVKMMPDKITIYQHPIESRCNDLGSLKTQIGHTVWHEVAHYYGLGHQDIEKLDRKL